MAEVAGYEGEVDVSDVAVVQIAGWTTDIRCEPGDTTKFSDNGWKTVKGLLKSGTGTIHGFHQSGAPQLTEGQSVALKLYTDKDNSKYYGGTALISGVKVAVDVNGVETIDFDYTWNGAVTEPA